MEMYCGCGAHTLPIAKSGLVDEVVAVEMDGRLAKACLRNCVNNGLTASLSGSDDERSGRRGGGGGGRRTTKNGVEGDILDAEGDEREKEDGERGGGIGDVLRMRCPHFTDR